MCASFGNRSRQQGVEAQTDRREREGSRTYPSRGGGSVFSHSLPARSTPTTTDMILHTVAALDPPFCLASLFSTPPAHCRQASSLNSYVPDELHQAAAVLPHRPQLLRQQAGLDTLKPELLRDRACHRAPPLRIFQQRPHVLELGP